MTDTDLQPKRPIAFVLMPFAPDFDDVYKLGIRGACEQANVHCNRADEVSSFSDPLPEVIRREIAECDLIIAEVTTANPNVLYESGYAHALGKPLIFLTESIEGSPFDIRHYQHIEYSGSITKLKESLKNRLQDYLAAVSGGFDVVADRKAVVPGAKIVCAYVVIMEKHAQAYLKLDIHNLRRESAQEVQVALLTPPEYQCSPTTSCIALPDGRNMHIMAQFGNIPPDAWVSTHHAFSGDLVAFTREAGLSASIKITARSGTQETAVHIGFQLNEE